MVSARSDAGHPASHARGLELIGRPALAQTGDYTARAEVIESRESTRQHDRHVEERVDDARAEFHPLRLGGDKGERLDRIVDVGVVCRRGPAWKGRMTWFDGPQQPLQRPRGIVVEMFSFACEARDHLDGTLLTVMGETKTQRHQHSFLLMPAVGRPGSRAMDPEALRA
jgi:hypothetical protein